MNKDERMKDPFLPDAAKKVVFPEIWAEHSVLIKEALIKGDFDG